MSLVFYILGILSSDGVEKQILFFFYSDQFCVNISILFKLKTIITLLHFYRSSWKSVKTVLKSFELPKTNKLPKPTKMQLFF